MKHLTKKTTIVRATVLHTNTAAAGAALRTKTTGMRDDGFAINGKEEYNDRIRDLLLYQHEG
ncbi:MAG: hypothetical protein HZC28_15670 [Spirochaetes bacterium]|nr:hypothetical protein [Spirochaetota bacterium]